MRPVIRDLLLGALFSGLCGVAVHGLWRSTLAGTLPKEQAALDPGFPPLPEVATRVASYRIEAKLDAALHRVTGKQTIEFVNRSNAPISELWFHLYLNAFKNDKTLFLRSPFGAGRSGDKAREYGYIDVKKLSVEGGDGADLWAQRDKHSPDDPEDETDLRVPLPAPLAAGQALVLAVEFEAQLPAIVERTGYWGSYHFVGQWFPKLARLEPNGQFAHFAFHAQSEFYADFGDYDVILDVPAAYRVGATGELVKETSSAGRKQLAYHVENVHDFAWTAWDAFQSKTTRIAGTEVTVLYPPNQERNADAELESVRFALPHFNRLYGAYPYPTLTLVHPPEAAANSGGMEYPTLFTTGGPWYATLGGVHAIDIVTVHELGHQWFYGMVASNEHTTPFLDEGLNSYAEAEAMSARYGAGGVYRGLGLTVASATLNRLFSASRGADEPVAQGAADFASFRNMGALVYARTATILSTIANVYGSARLNHALGVYTRKFRFQHPTANDFLAVMESELGVEAARAMRVALFERGTVDYLVRDLSTAPITPSAGVFDGPSGRETKKPDPEQESARYASRVVVYRHGSIELPVDIELTFEDRSTERRHWDGRGATFVVEHVGPSKAVAVVVDPEQRVLLDDDRSNDWQNNGRISAPRSLERALYAAQLGLGVLGP